MEIRIEAATPGSLEGYASIPIAFLVTGRLDLASLRAPDGARLVEVPEAPWTKDYDAHEDPRTLPSRFDLSHWTLLTAWEGGQRVGGAVVAWDTPGVDMLEGRRDLAVLWDIRVSPSARGQGIGRALFAAAVEWAEARGVTELKVETQDINVAACRFYARQGCRLSEIDEHAYGDLRETQLIWRLRLSAKNRAKV